jgi:RNA polymerase sigma factor (sigma-70 family)
VTSTMDRNDVFAAEFEEHRNHLRAVAYRMLGSRTEADDALQEAFLKVARSGDDPGDIVNMGGWLTTVVSRVCLTMLDSRRRRREEALEDERVPDPVVIALDADGRAGPEDAALMTDTIGVALFIVLEQLGPAERIAFVLHDLFAVPFDDVASILEKTPAAARQLASRARRRVRAVDTEAQAAADRRVVDAFLSAARAGDFAGLLEVLDPDVMMRGDGGAGTLRTLHGPEAIASQARIGAGQGRTAVPALIDGRAGFVGYQDGRPVAILRFTRNDADRVQLIEAIADPARVARVLGLQEEER